MAYVGLRPVTQTLSTATQYFDGDGSTLQFNLQQGVGKASDIIVAVGNTLQIPGTDYTASSTYLIFNAGKAPTSGTNNVSVTFISGQLQTLYVTANAYPIGNIVSPAIYSVSSPATGIYWPSTTSLGISASGNARVIISDTNQGNSTSTTSGALQVRGGIGATGETHIGGQLHLESGIAATNQASGALIVSGGVGISGDQYLGGTMTIAGGLTVAGAFNTTSTSSLTVNTPFVFLANTNVGDAIDQGLIGTYNDGVQRYTGLYRAQSDGRYRLFTNLDNQPSTLVDVANVSYRYADLWISNANVTATTAAVSSISAALTVWGGIGARGAIYLNSQNNSIAIGNGGTSGVGSIGASGAIFGAFWGTTANFNNTLTLNSTNQVQAITNGGSSGTGNIGASGATFNTIFAQATTATYADLAERYIADAECSPGTVVEFGGVWEVTPSTTDMSTRVAGVISTKPAFLMNEALEPSVSSQYIVDIALQGRVPCKVTGNVTKGDMLVSAGNGRARAEANPKIGSVIGKALENFEGTEGVIEVVVGRV